MISILWLCKKLILSIDVMSTHFTVPSPEGQHFLCVVCLSFYYLQYLISLRKEFSVCVCQVLPAEFGPGTKMHLLLLEQPHTSLALIVHEATPALVKNQ